MSTEAFTALKAGQFEAYIVDAKKALDGDGRDTFWKELAAQHPQQINVIDVLSTWPNERDYEIDTVLTPVLAHLPNINRDEFWRLLEIISVRNGSAYSVLTEVAKYLGRDSTVAIAFAAEMEAGTEIDNAIQRAWAETFSSGAPRVASEYLFSYFRRHGRLPAALKMLVLGLPDAELSARSAFSEFGDALVDAVISPTGQDEYLWLTVAKLGIVVPYASDVLMQAVFSCNLDAVRALAGALTRLNASEWGAQKLPLQGILENLVVASINDKDATTYVDHLLSLCISRQAAKKPAIEFLATLGAKGDDFTAILPSAFQAVFRDRIEFSILVTKWLLQPGANFNAISHLIGLYHAQGGAVRLDDELILAADPQRLVKLVRRVLALTYYGPSMCAYAGEILRITGLGSTGLKLGVDMFNEIYLEYPGAAEDYLRKKAEEVDAETEVGTIYRGLLENILQWRVFLDELPNVTELRASSLENIALSNVKSRVNRDIHKGAEEKSVFASLFSKNTIVQGSRFAAYNRNGPPSITHMVRSSHSVELPSSELADPLRGLIRRRRLLGDAE